MKYKYIVSNKYVRIKCENCDKYEQWFKNKDNVDMSQFCIMKGNKIE